MNLISYELTVPALSTWQILGVPGRKFMSLQVVGTQAFDLAFVPAGVLPETLNWLDGALTADNIRDNIPTSGDIWFRDTNNTGDEIIRVLSDAVPEFVNQT